MGRYIDGMADVTQILSQIESGNEAAAEQLLPLIYDELRKLAAARMAGEAKGHTLQPTALVHETYLRLVSGETPKTWKSRRHFFAAAALAMRRILVDSARKKRRLKRGGELEKSPIDDIELFDEQLPLDDLLALDEALLKLEQTDSEKAQLVQLRFFAGLDYQEAGELLGISVATAKRHWRFARAWLRQQMAGESGQ
jgi:RNA polymerase sigma factor (TIGR02999 family)